MRRCQTTRTLSQLNDTHFVPRVGALASPPGGGLQTGIAAEGRETPVATLAHSPGLTGDGERGADAWVALRHPRCLLHHAGTDNGSFAPLAGSDAGLKTGAPTTNPRFYLIGDGSFAPLTGSDAGLKTGAPTTNPRFYLIGDGSFAPLAGSDAGLKTGAPTPNPRFYLIGDGSFAPLTGSDAGLKTGAPTTNPRFYLIGDGSFAPLAGSDAGVNTGAPTPPGVPPAFFRVRGGGLRSPRGAPEAPRNRSRSCARGLPPSPPAPPPGSPR